MRCAHRGCNAQATKSIAYEDGPARDFCQQHYDEEMRYCNWAILVSVLFLVIGGVLLWGIAFLVCYVLGIE